MNRDMDVVRQIAKRLKEVNASVSNVVGIDDKVFRFNANLMREAGLVVANISESEDDSGAPKFVLLTRLTWSGFDFADASANDTIWNKTKAKIIDAGPGWTFSILMEALKLAIKSQGG